LSLGDVAFLHKAQGFGIKLQGFILIVNEYFGVYDFHDLRPSLAIIMNVVVFSPDLDWYQNLFFPRFYPWPFYARVGK
jgi:hypothetical protein